MTERRDPIAIVNDFCAAWTALDIEGALALLADDAVYHNIPVAPVVGKDAIRATIAMFTTGVEQVEFVVRNIAAHGDVVLTERLDIFTFANGRIELPVMGTFEIADGRIIEWRDYFDLQQYMSQIPGANG
ncbi:MAG TPA: limonene-1,2-epoxide hydrolase family protein [Acidimicrobiia bacterium]|nr:limonene-1,2-epoxide hydrolase family protein [Acidimicrobiia bacterium]